ncbi:hypothetical protein [Actinophytocola oryzae]|uniref:Uncharacterized protein n=1 Tax=Actinophytocola oryzae TaxID=502181 RepID=A0A4R7VRC3_9PSEU|nr:hypothetical protein [Actinophytocola oryzae]TDV52340.1 hypothetical protein CLV71_105472 [Actinophytocola oryzae]
MRAGGAEAAGGDRPHGQELAVGGHVHPANRTAGQRCHVFLATGLTPGEPHRELTEQWFPRVEVERMIP